MRTLAQKKNQAQKPVSSNTSQSPTALPHLHHRTDLFLHLQHATGNQAVQRMLQAYAEELDTGTTPLRSSHDVSPVPVSSHQPAAVQTKPAINEPGDEYEREADRVAEQVMRTPEPKVHRVHARDRERPGGPTERDPGGRPHIQAKHLGSDALRPTETPPGVLDVLRSPGRPLEPATRADMEARFGTDFSRVRVHSDAAAGRSARDLNARAYTAGRNIVFGPGRFAPGTHEGQRLLAHELSHVVQQNGKGHVIQRAPANYPSNEPPKPDKPSGETKQLTSDDWIWFLESFRRKSPEDFIKFLAKNEGVFYPILTTYGFHGSWSKDQDYLDDFDAAVAKWGKSRIYRSRSANTPQPVPEKKPKSREERKYEDANYIVRDMNRHGYLRSEVNSALESAGLMDDLVSHGFEQHGRWSSKNSEEYKNEAIVALNSYIDRYDAEHGNKRHTSASVPSQGEDIEFYKAWLEGLGYVTSSFTGALFAGTASTFTSDPKKIAAAAGLGAAFEGVVGAVGGALGGRGSYQPEVVRSEDRPAAVGAWRYTGKQPVETVTDPAKVAAPPAPDRVPTPDPARAPGKATDLAREIEQAEQRYERLREKASKAEDDYARSVRNTVMAKEQRGEMPTEQETDLLETKRSLQKARDDAKVKLDELKKKLPARQGEREPGKEGLAQESSYVEELRTSGLSAEQTDPNTPVIDAAIVKKPEVRSLKSIVKEADAAVRSAEGGSPRDLADRISAKVTESLVDRRSDKWSRLRNQWNNTKRAACADHFGYEMPKNPDDIDFVVDVRVLVSKVPSSKVQQAVEAAVTTWLNKYERIPPRFSWKVVYVTK